MENKIKLVIFDMDGLMFDTEKISYEAWYGSCKKYGYEMSREIFKKTLGTNLKRVSEIFVESFGEDFPMDQVILERNQISSQIVADIGVPMKEGLIQLLDYLKDKKVEIALATSASRARATSYINTTGLNDYFSHIVCGDEVKHSKPNPEIFLKVLECLQYKPNQVIVLEDSEAGIEAAYEAGMVPIMIPDIIQPDQVTKDRSFKVLSDLTMVIDVFEKEEV